MIKRMKKKNAYSAAIVVALVGLLLAGGHVFAGSDKDIAPRGSSSFSYTPKGAEGTGVATSDPLSASYDATTADEATPKGEHKSVRETAAKILYSISKHPVERGAKPAEWKIQQNKAAEAARAGHYDEALPVLQRLRAEHPEDISVASDYAAILGWAGRDADAVAAYKTLPPGECPDFLVDSIGHAYRNLHQPEEALAIYRLGLQTYPMNQNFVAGEILSLLEASHGKEAKERAQAATDAYATPSDSLSLAIKLAFRADAVSLARAGHYKEALAEFAALHKKYPADDGVSGDYVAVLSWAGRHADATVLYRTLSAGDQPDYVLDAAAHSYRALHQPKQALDLYQAALNKAPDNVAYAVGVIYSLSDLGRGKEAMAFAEAQLAKHPERPAALVKAYVSVKHRYAIDLARAGHFDQALSILRAMRAQDPSDITLRMDIIAVLSWAGRHEEAIKEYQKIEGRKFPDYVLEAVGGSYRALHQSGKALVVYRHGLSQSPSNAIFAAGDVRCLDDLGRYAEGQSRAEAFTRRYGDHLDVLLAGGEASNFNDQSIVALNFYQHAQALSSENKEAMRGAIHAEASLGAAQVALTHADRHPGLMNGEEYRALVGEADQALVRWGPLEPVSEATRFAATDRALASLNTHIGAWTALQDPAVYPNIQRARFDRLVALRDRQRMQDVVDDYNGLVGEGIEVPNYALEPVGEAYLYLRQPEIARDIFLKALQTDPDDFETRRLLAYAYLEADQYDEAFATIDKVREDEPVWVYLKGEPERLPNTSHVVADHSVTELDAGELRLYSDLLEEADTRLTPIVQAGPFDARNRAAAGNVYFARGWPRKAMEHYDIGLAIQDGHDVANETGMVFANLALQNFQKAEEQARDLRERFPENLGVQRANRAWDVHAMAELDVHAGYSFAPSGGASAGDVPHGQGFNVGATLYSAPLAHNWRLFAGEDFAHEHQPNAEGTIDTTRSTAGVEYRKGDVTATVAPTFNTYDSRERVGANGTVKYTFNDIWSAGIAAELFSAATPLRALNAGVTANRYDVSALWRQSESRQVSVGAYVMPFSDGNFRTVEEAEYLERLYTHPKFRVEAEVNLASTQNNKDENRLYYNPSLDLTALAGLRATHTLYHRYETLYEHSLLAMPGLYAQQHYGTSPAWVVRYEQRVHYNDTLDAGAGVNYAHQNYNGSAEDAVSLTVDVVERF